MIRRSFLCALCALLALASTSCNVKKQPAPTVNVLISPYQDLAMMVNAKPLGLEKKYGVNINVSTISWENIMPSVASASNAPTIGFASYVQFSTQEDRINPPGADPVVFVYPAYVFNGGAFVSFNKDVPTLTPSTINDPQVLRRFLSFRIGAQKGSLYEMMLYTLASRAGMNVASLHIVDMPLNNALLASENHTIDIGEAGLTQSTEALKQGGNVVLTMQTMGFADLTGFVCKQSFLSSHPEEVKAVMDMWFDSVDYVMSNLDFNSSQSLAYLKANAATQYTLTQYKDALAQEVFPRNPTNAYQQMVAQDGLYSALRIGDLVGKYLLTTGQVKKYPALPTFSVSP